MQAFVEYYQGRQTKEAQSDGQTSDTLFGLASCLKAFLVTSIGLPMHDFANGHNVMPLLPTLPDLIETPR
ncbi:hypothetical protein A0H81_05175 [Grifola frondosa]|uniref:Uncharacterized protein n=1 Tax=Grifola frondosa TaxID=5627 RepID=A0A1C7MDR1_GRIFR|nr:hypothetical protein A0H81_05175 [Grifola frondosa]